jgi:hypothetical protein
MIQYGPSLVGNPESISKEAIGKKESVGSEPKLSWTHLFSYSS